MLDTSAKRTRQRQMLRRQHSYNKKKGLKTYWLPLAGKSVALGVMGVCYGVVIGHLHDRQQIAPIKVDGIPHHSWGYLGFWGVVAMALGGLMPMIDQLWEGEEDETVKDDEVEGKVEKKERSRRGGWAPEWNDVVRSIGAFVGVAFAIVSLPSSRLFCTDADTSTEKASLAVNAAALADACTFQPGNMVYPRPYTSWLGLLDDCRTVGYRTLSGHQPRAHPLAGWPGQYTLWVHDGQRQLDRHCASRWRTRSWHVQPREHWCGHMDC